MLSLPGLISGLVIAVISYIAWHILKPFFVVHPWSNIPGPPSSSWLTGNFFQFYSTDGWQFHRDLVEKYGGVSKVYGLLGDQMLYVTDPKALHHIFVKDQDVYEESPTIAATSHLMFGESLVSSLGEKHKRQRRVLNPVFSINHMRGLTGIFYAITHDLCERLTKDITSGAKEVDMMDWMSRASLEYIGQGGLGYSFDALDRTKTNAYAESVSQLFPTILELAFWREFLPTLMKLTGPKFRRKLVEWAPFAKVQKARRIIDIMDETSLQIYKDKKHSVDEGKVGRDMMSVLLKANMDTDVKDQLPEVELLGQMTLLIFAGQDTTSHALSRILHLLCLHPDAQDRLRKEVTLARQEHGDMDYDTIMALPYLDSICRETLRLHPPVNFVNRMATQDVVMPLMFPIKGADGRTDITEVLVKKNQFLWTSILGANRSKAVWGEDAEEWKPDRWKALPESVSKARLPGVYSSMMTFVGGSRACIGFKFAELEMKIVLSMLLEKFEFALSDKDIYWHMSPIVAPIVRGTQQSQLPLCVSIVQK